VQKILLLFTLLFYSSAECSRKNAPQQAQATQQRPKPGSTPPSYGQVTNSSKVHRREGHLSSVQMKLAIHTFFFFPSAECSSPVAAGNGLGTGLGTTVKNVRTC
jgi:hypothetical protein